MTMEKCFAWIVREEINLHRAVGGNGHNIFEQARALPACDAHNFKAVPMQVQWMSLTAGVDEDHSIALPMLYLDRLRVWE